MFKYAIVTLWGYPFGGGESYMLQTLQYAKEIEAQSMHWIFFENVLEASRINKVTVVTSSTKIQISICKIKADEIKTGAFSLLTDISLISTIPLPNAIIGAIIIPIPRIKAYSPNCSTPR